MGKKIKYVVRVVINPTDGNFPPLAKMVDEGFIDCLRYAGLIRVHERLEGEGQCFDLICPSGLDSKMWSEVNAQRMQSFGYNAVLAPSTED